MQSRSASHRMAETLGGIPILHSFKNSPAALAGIRVGDILLEVNGHKVQNFQDYVHAKDNGLTGSMSVLIWRDGQEMTFTLVFDSTASARDPNQLLEELNEARVLEPGDQEKKTTSLN